MTRRPLLALFAVLLMTQSIAQAAAPTTPRVLIATQTTPYKDAVTEGLVAHLKSRSVAVQVVDIAALDTVDPAQFKAIVLLHTWEMERPPEAVQQFVDQLADSGKLVVHTTSGDGNAKLPGVDAISGASNVLDAGLTVKALAARVDALLPR